MPFKTKGWPYYDRMKQLMPSKGKGLNRFSALSIDEPRSSRDTTLGVSTSESEGGEGSGGTVGVPFTPTDIPTDVPGVLPASSASSAVQEAPAQDSVSRTNNDVEMTSPQQAHPPSMTTATFKQPSTISAYTRTTFNWTLD